MLSKLICHFDGKIHEKKEFQNSNVGGKQIENMSRGGFEISSTLVLLTNLTLVRRKAIAIIPKEKFF